MRHERNTAMMSRLAGTSRGFTLIELMIVVVIVAILLGVAAPMYQENMRKTRRADAKAALMRVANLQEQFMLDNSTYTIDMEELNLVGTSGDPFPSEEGHYQVVAAACAPDITRCYALTATPQSGSPQTKDTKCASFSLNSKGAKSATGTLITECW